MVIEESVTINAETETVWRTFADLSCWNNWSSVLTGVSHAGAGVLEEGTSFSFCIRPFALPVRMNPVVEEVVPGERIVWSGRKFGVRARHEYIFEPAGEGVRVTSREEFGGMRALLLVFKAAKWRLRQLTYDVLMELKSASESAAGRARATAAD